VFWDDELRWLARHGFSTDDVYDGRGQSQRARRRGAKDVGKTLVLGSVCQHGHRLKTRSHHCVQCNPINLAFQQRYRSPGYVYVAGSLSGRVIKIGTARDISQRENQLRSERHAGLGDWEVLFFIRVTEAGRVEHEASERLASRRVYRQYIKDGICQMATEVIQCSFSAGLKAVTEVVGQIDGCETWQWTHASRYEFI
jgi:hypothetical protein